MLSIGAKGNAGRMGFCFNRMVCSFYFVLFLLSVENMCIPL